MKPIFKSIKLPSFKLLISTLAVFLYILTFGAVQAQFGAGTTALSLIVVVIIAWYYGFIRGLLSGFLMIFLNVLLLSWIGDFTWEQLLQTSSTLGMLMLLLSGGGIGRIRELQKEFSIQGTENHRLWYQLKAEQILLQNLLEHIPDAIYFKDSQTQFIRINPAHAKILGIADPQEAVGKTDFDFFPELFAKTAFNDDQHVLKTGQPVVNRLEHFIDKDEHETWLATTKAAMYDSNGMINGLVGISRDITERKIADEGIRINEERYRSAYDSSPLAFIIWDNTYRVTDWNKRAEQIFGWSREEVLGRNFFEFLIPESELQDTTQKVSNLFREHTEHYTINQNLTKSGKVIVCEWHNTPIHGPDGKTIGAVSLGLDITQRQRIEVLEREQRILAEALRDTSAALTSTLSLDEVLDRILSNVGRVVSHEGVNIMLIEDSHVRVVRAKGYSQKEVDGYLKKVDFSIPDFKNFNLMMKTGRPISIADTSLDPKYVHPSEISWIRSYAGAPIKIRDKAIGFLNLDSSKVGFFTPELADRLQAFADQAGMAIENAQLYDKIQELASKDSITGLLNRRGLSESGQKEINRALRLYHPLSAIMLDVDNYKNVNDRYGHLIGDQVLCEIAKICKWCMRDIDIIGRYGGDEFTVLIIECDKKGAYEAAERLREAIEKMAISIEKETLHITVSLGLSEIDQHTASINELLSQADSALYQAKRNGKNCVCIFKDND